jgi:hypothetical protein
LSIASADAKKPNCTVRAHLQGNANDSATFATEIRSAITGRNVVIQKVPAISEQDVVAFRPYQLADGTYGVLFQLDDHGRLALDSLSIEKRGTYLYIFVNGRPAAELQIDRRVADGKLYVPSGLTVADLKLMRKDWPLIGERKK